MYSIAMRPPQKTPTIFTLLLPPCLLWLLFQTASSTRNSPSVVTAQLRLSYNASSSPPIPVSIPSTLNILLFYSPKVQLNSLETLLAWLPPYSLTIVCPPPLSCPQILNSTTHQLVTSLATYKPPFSADTILVLDAAASPILDPVWLYSAIQLTHTHSHIVALAGLVTSSSSSSPSITCLTHNSLAGIPLAPFTIATHNWPSQHQLESLATALDLSILLASSSTFVLPLTIMAPGVSDLCASAIQHMLLQGQDSGHWHHTYTPLVGILLAPSVFDLPGELELCCDLVRKFDAHLFLLPNTTKGLANLAKNRLWETCAHDIPVEVLETPQNANLLSPFRATQLILTAHPAIEVLFYLPNTEEFHGLPPAFNKSSLYPISHGHPQDLSQFCVLICLPISQFLAADWILGLDLQALKNWHKPKIDISVITNDRSVSLKRLLNSLAQAVYYGDRVDLVINMEQTSDQVTREVVEGYTWKHGTKTVRQRVIQGGLLPAVVEAWYPSSAHDSYGVLLEDDVEVSGHFYGWLKFGVLNYRYSAVVDGQIYGIALYQPQHNELRPEGRRLFNASSLLADLGLEPPTMPYSSQVPCSWGALFFPELWADFHRYLAFRLTEMLPGVRLEDSVIASPIRSDRWPKSWKKYLIEWVYLRGLVMIYPNYHSLDALSGGWLPAGLSTNHLELGTHVHDRVVAGSMRYGRGDVPSVPEISKRERLKKEFEIPLKALAPASSLLDGLVLPGHPQALPSGHHLVHLDLWAEPTSAAELSYRGAAAAISAGLCAPLLLQQPPLDELAQMLATICL